MEPKEIIRQSFHMIIGIVVLLLLYFDFIGSEWLLIIFIAGLAVSLLLRGSKHSAIVKFIEKYERPIHRKLPGKGPIFFFLGAWLVVRFFPKDIALAAIAILAFGDALSTMISLSNGRTKHPLCKNKLLEGSLAGTAVGFLVAMIFVVWWQALIAAFIAMIIEAIEIKIYAFQIDDNLSVPVIAAAVIFLLQMI
ncbi:MAG: hypothetical protein ABIE94_05300 [archaeon]